MSGLAGRLRVRVTIARPAAARDAIGAWAGEWNMLDEAWAAVACEGRAGIVAGDTRSGLTIWAVTLRPTDLRVGDRIGWGGTAMIVREIVRDPTLPDRIEAVGEEVR